MNINPYIGDFKMLILGAKRSISRMKAVESVREMAMAKRNDVEMSLPPSSSSIEGKNRMDVTSKPDTAKIEKKAIMDINTDAIPMSLGSYKRAAITQNKKPVMLMTKLDITR